MNALWSSYGHPTDTIRPPCGHPANTLPTPNKHPAETLRTPCGHATDTLRTSYGHPMHTLCTPSCTSYAHPIDTLCTSYCNHTQSNAITINSLRTCDARHMATLGASSGSLWQSYGELMKVLFKLAPLKNDKSLFFFVFFWGVLVDRLYRFFNN
jgi:hypothetical protein